MNAEFVCDSPEHAYDIRERASQFAIKIVKAYQALSRNEVARVIGRQLLRSGTAVGANISEAQAGFTRQDFAHAMNIARKEALETKYWLELMAQCNASSAEFAELAAECDEISRILTAIVKKTQAPRPKPATTP